MNKSLKTETAGAGNQPAARAETGPKMSGAQPHSTTETTRVSSPRFQVGDLVAPTNDNGDLILPDGLSPIKEVHSQDGDYWYMVGSTGYPEHRLLSPDEFEAIQSPSPNPVNNRDIDYFDVLNQHFSEMCHYLIIGDKEMGALYAEHWKRVWMTEFNQGQRANLYDTYRAAIEELLPNEDTKMLAYTLMDITPEGRDPVEAMAELFGVDLPEPEPDITYLLKYPLDDEGNAQCVVERHQRFLYTDAYGWLMYRGTHWARAGAEAELHRAIVETLKARMHALINADRADVSKGAIPSATRVRNVLFHLTSILYVLTSEFDNHPDILNCANGVVNLKTGAIEDHSIEQRFLYCVPTPYIAGRCSEDWENFLAQVIGNYEAIKGWLQMAAGYSLTGHTSEEILFYLYGPRRSGKGTFANTQADVLGRPLAVGVDFASFTADRDNDANNFDLAGLQQTRMVITSETSRYARLSPKRIKTITGRDPLRASFKHKDAFEFYATFKIWLQSNWPVNADPDDDAMWSRLRVIEFPNSYYGKEDKGLKTRLLSETNRIGILAWAVQGAMNWYRQGIKGLETPAEVINQTEQHQSEQDFVQQWLEECTEPKTDWLESSDATYKTYQWWCDKNGVTPKGKNQFTVSLKAKGFTCGKGYINKKQVRCIFGLRLLVETVKIEDL